MPSSDDELRATTERALTALRSEVERAIRERSLELGRDVARQYRELQIASNRPDAAPALVALWHRIGMEAAGAAGALTGALGPDVVREPPAPPPALPDDWAPPRDWPSLLLAILRLAILRKHRDGGA